MSRLAAVLLGLVLLVSACGGGVEDAADPESSGVTPTGTSSGPSASASPRRPACADTDAWKPLAQDGPSGMMTGHGRTAVVFINTAGGSACDWVDYATTVAADGHRVAVWDYATAGGPLEDRLAELDSVVAQVQKAGSARVLLVGGSRGGCLALLDAAANRDVSGVAVLSCAKVWNREDPTPVTRHLSEVTVPVLSVIASKDPDVPEEDVRRDLAALASPQKEALVVKGFDHGTALLSSAKVRAALDAFIATNGT